MRRTVVLVALAVAVFWACLLNVVSHPWSVSVTARPIQGRPTQDFMPPPVWGSLAFTDPPTIEQVACSRRAQQVRVAYQPTRTMTVGRQEQIEVVLTVDKHMKVSLPGDGQVVMSDTRLGCVIQAQIIGGEDFSIDPKSVEERTFLTDDTVRFSWIIMPKRVGPSVLELQVQSVVSPGGNAYAVNPQSFTAAINIEAIPHSTWQRITDAAQAFVDFPLVKGAGVLVAFFGMLVGIKKYLRGKAA